MQAKIVRKTTYLKVNLDDEKEAEKEIGKLDDEEADQTDPKQDPAVTFERVDSIKKVVREGVSKEYNDFERAVQVEGSENEFLLIHNNDTSLNITVTRKIYEDEEVVDWEGLEQEGSMTVTAADFMT